MFDSRDFFPLEEISPPKYNETHVESPILISPSSSVGSSSPVRSTTLPLDYPFDKSIFTKLDNSLWIIPRPPRSEPVPEESNEMPPKRTSTSEEPAITQAAIKKLVADSVSAALKAQAATMAGAVDLIRWFERTESVFSRSKCVEENKYCPRTEVSKMEDELYNLTVKGNDLKTYIRRFQELVVLCPNMVPNTKKLLEAFTGGLPRSIEGNGLEKSIDQSDLESCESSENKSNNESDLKIPIWRINSVNTPYSVEQRTTRPDGIKSEHLYSANANEIDEKRPELKTLPNHLKCAYLQRD
ncbi:hypothetical protein Tco_0922288 [Tanacetum coccineum]|uniref:Retrotransposon gag domain-containing protein n=1 Tax=Tanacetum coccineum TaxID=301880 RepID=A0ABQ5D4X1_9ASTR